MKRCEEQKIDRQMEEITAMLRLRTISLDAKLLFQVLEANRLKLGCLGDNECHLRAIQNVTSIMDYLLELYSPEIHTVVREELDDLEADVMGTHDEGEPQYYVSQGEVDGSR